jgi:predicted DNA-binding transcriptional regulator AlpA
MGGLTPRGLRKADAAIYVGISPSLFDAWVASGVMPKPKRHGGVVVWDRRELDVAFDALGEAPTELGNELDGFF